MTKSPDAQHDPTPRDPTGRDSTPRDPGPRTPPAKTGKTVLVADDEADLVDLIGYNLKRHGYEVRTAADGPAALESARRQPPDLIVLDVMMPGLDGTEVCRRLKADPKTAKVPVVMLTARGEETDIVVGLTLGADDYVTKPFSMKVLLARLAVLLRRNDPGAPAPDAELLRAGPLTIDPHQHQARIDGEALKLTLTEFKLLSALVQARGRVLSRDQLMDKAMGADVFVTDRAIDVHVTAIRRKLGVANWLVQTVRGVGYRLQESPDAGEA